MLLKMLFAVSWNDIGRSLAENFPKNERNSAASEALNVIGEYVEITSIDDEQTEDEDMEMEMM